MPHSRFKVGSHRKNAKTGGDDHNRSGAHRRAHSARADGRPTRTPKKTKIQNKKGTLKNGM